MGLFVPSSKPRRFHLELTQRDERRMRLRDIKENAGLKERSGTAVGSRAEENRQMDGDYRSDLTSGSSSSNFEYLRGRLRTDRQRKAGFRGLAMCNGLLIVLIVGLVALAWLLLNF